MTQDEFNKLKPGDMVISRKAWGGAYSKWLNAKVRVIKPMQLGGGWILASPQGGEAGYSDVEMLAGFDVAGGDAASDKIEEKDIRVGLLMIGRFPGNLFWDGKECMIVSEGSSPGSWKVRQTEDTTKVTSCRTSEVMHYFTKKFPIIVPTTDYLKHSVHNIPSAEYLFFAKPKEGHCICGILYSSNKCRYH